MAVSIPSLSGLRFNAPRCECTACGCSLNPFFIRASFQPHGFRRLEASHGLNPFFIRASFQLFARKEKTCTNSSQSLLYQGFVSTTLWDEKCKIYAVSIPSLSGLRFNTAAVQHSNPAAAAVSIPSLSGLRFNVSAVTHLRERLRLNPFFIRASFQQRGGRTMTIPSLNPFFIRASFQPLAVVTPFPFNPIQTHFPILSALRQVHLASLWKTRTSQRPLLSILQPGRTRWTETTLSECNESGTSRLRARAER